MSSTRRFVTAAIRAIKPITKGTSRGIAMVIGVVLVEFTQE